jgi:hypothetical protein
LWRFEPESRFRFGGTFLKLTIARLGPRNPKQILVALTVSTPVN